MNIAGTQVWLELLLVHALQVEATHPLRSLGTGKDCIARLEIAAQARTKCIKSVFLKIFSLDLAASMLRCAVAMLGNCRVVLLKPISTLFIDGGKLWLYGLDGFASNGIPGWAVLPKFAVASATRTHQSDFLFVWL